MKKRFGEADLVERDLSLQRQRDDHCVLYRQIGVEVPNMFEVDTILKVS